MNEGDSRFKNEIDKYIDLFTKAIIRDINKNPSDLIFPIHLSMELTPNEFGNRLVRKVKITQEDLQ